MKKSFDPCQVRFSKRHSQVFFFHILFLASWFEILEDVVATSS